METIKDRLWAIIDNYDWQRLPYRDSMKLRSDVAKLCWEEPNGEFLIGDGRGAFSTYSSAQVGPTRLDFPEPIIRDNISFFCSQKKPITVVKDKLIPLTVDEGYIEAFIDLVTGALGTLEARDGIELWRRYRCITERIQSIDEFYNITKPLPGAHAIFMDIIECLPLLITKVVISGTSIGDKVMTKFAEDKLTDSMIPKNMLGQDYMPSIKDLNKAKEFFDMVSDGPESKHNLLLATVYPYYRDGNEKFFVLKGTGGNGKSTYLSHFPTILGERFGVVDLEAMAGSGFDRQNAISALMGKLVVQAPETDLESPKFVSQLKKIATGDRMTTRLIGGNSFWFKCEPTLFIDTNTNVNIEDTAANNRRTVNIRFTPRRIPREEMSPYFNWIASKKGAAAIYLHAYLYFIEECESQFIWEEVVLEGKTSSSPIAERMLVAMWDSYKKEGLKAMAKASLFSGSNREKAACAARIGLKSAVKRINGDTTARFYIIDDEALFLSSLTAYGIR